MTLGLCRHLTLSTMATKKHVIVLSRTRRDAACSPTMTVELYCGSQVFVFFLVLALWLFLYQEKSGDYNFFVFTAMLEIISG